MGGFGVYSGGISKIEYNSDALDGFSRLPVAQPQTLFDAQFTYDLQPLLYEEVKSGSQFGNYYFTCNRTWGYISNTGCHKI